MAPDIADLRLLGGRPAVDFVNTVDWRTTPEPVELLGDYGSLARWAARAGVLAAGGEAPLLAAAAADPPAAGRALRRARERREALYATLVALATGAEPPRGGLDRLRRGYAEAVARAAAARAGDAVALDWSRSEPALDRPLWPVLADAWALVASPELARLKLCPGDGCGWLFVDRSKSGTRRWCSMEGCGSRMKMRRAYARTRSSR